MLVIDARWARTGLAFAATLLSLVGCGSTSRPPAEPEPAVAERTEDESASPIANTLRECFGEAAEGVHVEAPATVFCPGPEDFAAADTGTLSAEARVPYFIVDGELVTPSLWGDGTDSHFPLVEARSGMELTLTGEDPDRGEAAEAQGLPGRGRWQSNGERTVDGVLFVGVMYTP